jgi:hypothetical protein
MDLEYLLDEVKDRASFLAFVKALEQDRREEVAKEKLSPISPYGPGANGWENGTIEDYLDACVACAEDWEDRPGGLPETASWATFAKFLYCGKGYE